MFLADDEAVANTSTEVDKEHVNKEFTHVMVQASKSPDYNFSFPRMGQLKRSQNILSSLQ